MITIAIRQRLPEYTLEAHFAGRAFEFTVLVDKDGCAFRAKHLCSQETWDSNNACSVTVPIAHLWPVAGRINLSWSARPAFRKADAALRAVVSELGGNRIGFVPD